MYSLNHNVTYFHSFGVEHIAKEIKNFITDKNTKRSTIAKTFLEDKHMIP